MQRGLEKAKAEEKTHHTSAQVGYSASGLNSHTKGFTILPTSVYLIAL